MEHMLHRITEKRKKLQLLQPFSPEFIKNFDEWIKIELTYTSNAIEGNTLSRPETALIVEKGITIGGKSVNEHLEAINHAHAFELVQALAHKKREPVSENNILDIHRIILSKIDDANAGRYRTVPVRIAGSTVIMPNPLKVPFLMLAFERWLHAKNDEHSAKIAADAHLKLVTIHPFTDGNGRTARLLMNLLLMKNGYPPAIIKKEDRIRYINAVEKAQLSGETDDYYKIIFESIETTFDMYFETLGEKTDLLSKKQGASDGKMLKIGKLAKALNESVPTIRHWTREGLLEVAKYTPSGYQLYDYSMVARAKKIRQLQRDKRLTISEIKKALLGYSE